MFAEVLKFWFEEISPAQWWQKDAAFDRLLAERFAHLVEQASRGELYSWRQTVQGRLAEILLLDQFSRNIYRDTPRAFAQDAMALVLAQEGVSAGVDRELPAPQRHFFYMPYMHSESSAIHRVAESLFDQPGLEQALLFERKHKAIIDRFGRYPHRNAILGRSSTPEEIAFLQQPGSSF